MIGAINYKCGNETKNQAFEEFAQINLSKTILTKQPMKI